MIRGKFFAQDDFDLAKHHLLNWDYLDDIPHADAEDGQVIARVAGNVVWADLAAGGIVSVDWDDITGKPSTFPPDSHGHPWDAITDKPTFVNSLTTGEGIQISSQTGDVTIEDSYHFDNNDPNGFVNTTDSSFTVDSSNLLFTIDAVSPTDGYGFYVKGKKFLYTESHSVAIDEIEGIHAIYFNENGTLTRVTAPLPDDVFTEKALVAIFRWDDDSSEAIYVGEERHGIIMDGRTHQYLHDSEGTRYISGMALGNISSDENGSSDAHATLSVGGGTIADEDLFLDASATASTYADWYTYSKTDAGLWRRTATGSVPVNLTAGVTATYNELNGTTWQQTQLSNNQYVLAHIFRTNSITRPFISVQGENVYGNQAAARAGATDELLALYTDGMPFVEFSPLGTVIYQYSSAYGNSFNLRVRTTDIGDDYVDWRQANLQASGSGPSDHGSLSGLADSDHPTSALQQTGATTNQVIQWNGTTWLPATLSGSGLGVSSVAANAPLSANTSVGDVTLTFSGSASDVGLGNVTNEKQVVQGTSGLQNDYASSADPPGTSYVLIEAIGGSQRIAQLSALPMSTEVQSYVDALTATDVGAAAVTHTHSLSDIEQSGATTGQVPTWNATTTEWEPATPSGGSSFSHKHTAMIYIENMSSTDTFPMFCANQTLTIDRITAYCADGLFTFDLYECAGGSPDAAGTAVNGAAMLGFTTEQVDTSFSNSGIAARAWVVFKAASVTGPPSKSWITVEWTED